MATYGNDVQSQMPAGFTQVVHVTIRGGFFYRSKSLQGRITNSNCAVGRPPNMFLRHDQQEPTGHPGMACLYHFAMWGFRVYDLFGGPRHPRAYATPKPCLNILAPEL